MRRDTKFKKSLGYSQMIEVPAPVYLQAALMGLVDMCPKGFYYVLPVGDQDIGPNYVRCSHVDPHMYNYVPTAIKAWNERERTGIKISINGGTQKVREFLRGRLVGKPDPMFLSSEERGQHSLMRLYLEQLVETMETYRDWNLSIEDFVFRQTDRNSMEWMLEVLNSNVFDLMHRAHSKYVTEKTDAKD